MSWSTKELKRTNGYLNESKIERGNIATEVDKYKEKLLNVENKLKEKNSTIQSTAELVENQKKILEKINVLHNYKEMLDGQ